MDHHLHGRLEEERDNLRLQLDSERAKSVELKANHAVQLDRAGAKGSLVAERLLRKLFRRTQRSFLFKTFSRWRARTDKCKAEKAMIRKVILRRVNARL